MNIIVISLERAKERRESIKAQLAALKLDAIIMDAVDGASLRRDQLDVTINNPGRWRDKEKFNPGEIGCIMSNIKAIEIAQEKNWDDVIIIEDDVVLSEDFEKGINFLYKILPNDWEHVFLGGHIYMGPVPVFQPTVIISDFKISGSYAYILKKPAYEKLRIELALKNAPADDVIEHLILAENKLKSYIFFPFLAYPKQNYSYIWNREGGTQMHASVKYFRNKLFN